MRRRRIKLKLATPLTPSLENFALVTRDRQERHLRDWSSRGEIVLLDGIPVRFPLPLFPHVCIYLLIVP